jgi:hypothetical protein
MLVLLIVWEKPESLMHNNLQYLNARHIFVRVVIYLTVGDVREYHLDTARF